jgi:NADPH:quinone reductase-like Zn-dependent oxidoreductase
MGAEVTAVCSTRNVDTARSLGADRVIDYTQEDFIEDTQRYDVLFDGAGNRPLLACKRVLTADGVLVMIGAPKSRSKIAARMAKLLLLSLVTRKFKMFIARLRKDDLRVLAEMMTAGKVTPSIERTYALEDIALAMQYARSGHARGKLVITM